MNPPRSWPEEYKALQTFETSLGPVRLWLSASLGDPLWDTFLQQNRVGQFQQSSLWAEYKAIEGWNCHRLVASIEDQIVGSCQVLWRGTRLGRVGYVSKRPIAAPEAPGLVQIIVSRLCRDAKKLRLPAVIAQPPDDSQVTSGVLNDAGFLESNPMGVIETTLLVDATKGREEVQERMSRSTRRNIKLGLKAGIVVREGAAKDAGSFFDLMKATCRRQNTAPNPSSAQAMEHLWKVLDAGKCLKVFFAAYQGETVAGLLSIPFGRKVNVWKKGWNSRFPELHPNDLLYCSTVTWAADNKFNCCDFAGFDRSIAVALAQGIPLSKSQQETRHVFNLRFGGIPVLLPPARIWLVNPVLRFSYRQGLMRTGLIPLIGRILS